MTQNPEESPIHGSVHHLNPETLHNNPAFTQVITVTGPARTIYIGGQDAVDAQGHLVGKGDLAAQTHQVLLNLRTALAAASARPEHIIKWNVYLVQGQSLQAGFTAFQQFWGDQPDPPTITGIYVSGLAHPDFLVEMDAIAVVPLQLGQRITQRYPWLQATGTTIGVPPVRAGSAFCYTDAIYSAWRKYGRERALFPGTDVRVITLHA